MGSLRDRWLTRGSLALFMLFLAFAGVMVVSAHPGPVSPGVIHSCVNNNSGAIQIVAPTTNCIGNTTSLDWNAQGPAGPAGADGAQGPAGPIGPIGPPGLSGLVTVSVTVDRTTSGSQAAIAFCPGGKQVIGGGARVTPSNGALALQASRPFGNGWEANANTTVVQNFNWSVTADAICATVAP